MHVKLVGVGSWDGMDEEPVEVLRLRRDGRLGPNDRHTLLQKRGASRELLDKIAEHQLGPDELPLHVIALGAHEGYSCFPAGAMVRMADGGVKPIELVRLADMVVDRWGRPGEVTTVYTKPYSGAGVVLSIAGMLENVTCTDKHKFYVIPHEQVRCDIDGSKHCKPGTCQRNAICAERNCPRTEVRFDPTWVEADRLRPGDYALIPIPDRGIGLATWTWSVPLARVFGYWLAEGCFVKSKKGKLKGLRIVFNLNEEETLGDDLVRQVELLKSEYGSLEIRGPYRNYDNHVVVYVLRDDSLAERAFRAMGEYATGKRLSGEVYSQPPAVLANFIACYVDGDGTHPEYTRPDGYEESRYTAGTASKQLAQDLQWIAGRLGCVATVCRARPADPINGASEFYHVSFSNSAGKFLDGLCGKYRDCPPNQFKQHSFIWNGFVCRPIRSVATVELDEPVFNLEVSSDHSYTVANGVCVKNCNRNGDTFTEEECKAHHDRFVKDARYYMNHKNRDPAKSYGIVKASVYNQPMRRVELLIFGNEKQSAADRNGGLVMPKTTIDKLNAGQALGWSMACVSDPTYPVLTRDRGYVPISEIRIGDVVLTHLGRWRAVKGVNRRRYTGELRELRVNGLPLPLELTADHMMWAKTFAKTTATTAVRYFRDPAEFEKVPAGWLHTEHLDVGDRLFYQPVPAFSGYGRIDSRELAAIMGYYLAEGSFTYNGDKACTTQFTCNMSDSLPRRLPKLIEALFQELSVDIAPRKNSKVALCCSIHSTDFSEFLRKYVGRGAATKTIPPEIFNSSRDVKLAFLGAWLDGDGWADKKGIHWSSCNRDLLLQGRDLLISIGIPASIYKIDHSKCETSGYENSGVEYTLNVSHLDSWNLSGDSEKTAQYPVPSVNRNKPSAMRRCPDGRYAYRIAEVKTRFVEDLETYNIEIEEDESYTLAGLISHNCRVSHDVCSNCHNKAANRSEYCTEETCVDPKTGRHMPGCRFGLTKLGADGFQQFVYNPDAYWFDISHVGRQADRVAFGGLADYMMKRAEQDGQVLGGSELAELAGLSVAGPLLDTDAAHKQLALLLKLAEIERAFDSLPDLHRRAAVMGRPLDPATPPPTTADFSRSGNMKRAAADQIVLTPVWFLMAAAPRYEFDKAAACVAGAGPALGHCFSLLEQDPGLMLALQGNAWYRATTSTTDKMAADDAVNRWVYRNRGACSIADTWAIGRIQASLASPEKTAMLDSILKTGSSFSKAVSMAEPFLQLARQHALYQLGALSGIEGIERNSEALARVIAGNRA